MNQIEALSLNPQLPEAAPKTSKPTSDAMAPSHLPFDYAGEASKIELIALPILRLGNHEDLKLEELLASPLGRKLAKKVARGDKLRFLLPAFPAKSSNRDKTDGPAPDLGEYLGLKAMNEMCAEISRHHAPGAEVVICSDGRVFNDLVMVSDEDLEIYSQKIREMIEVEGFEHLSTYSLEDCAHLFDADRLKEDFVEQFGPSVEDIREAARQCPERRSMCNGIHRFMKDDLGFHFPELSKNQVMKRSKKLSYQVVQRSQSWDNLLETIFPDTLRLSIHPYPVAHRKFGVKLVATSDRWATPWHNVTVVEDGKARLMKRREALALGAQRELWNGKYVCYAIR